MKPRANKGLSRVYWIVVVTLAALVILGGILWWYDGAMIQRG